jgi:hypothetical protein
LLVSVGSRHASSTGADKRGRPTLLVRTPLHDALLAVHSTDAHLFYYFDPDAAETRRHSAEHPHDRLDALRIDTIFADIDNAKHAPWSDEATALAAGARARDLAQTAGVYVTRGGLRIAQPLEVALPVHEADAALRAWYVELERRGLAVDHSTSQWTRCMRLPHVTRDGSPYRSPFLDLSRMRPVPPPAGGFARRVSTKGGPLVDVLERIDLPPAWTARAAELRPVIAAEPKGVEHGWHKLGMRLAGAAMQLGLRPEHAGAFVLRCFPEGADRANLAAGARDTARKYASRRGIQGLRALEDAHPRVYAALRPPERSPMPDALPPAAEVSEALLEHLRAESDGLRLIQAGCGVGKTRAARIVAAERAARDESTVIAVPTHELAIQIAADLRAEGVEVRRVFGPLSVRSADGKHACRYHVPASRLAEGRQSVRRALCDGETPCEYRDGCEAYAATDGAKEALVTVGPHALLRGLVGEAGKSALLVLDEPPTVTEQLALRMDRLQEVESYADRFEKDYVKAILPSVHLVRWWLTLGRMGEIHHLSEAFDLECPERAQEARRALEWALVGHEAPPLLPSAARRCKADPTLATPLGRVSKTLDVLRRAMVSQETRARIELMPGDTRQLALTLLREDLALALRREGPTVVAAADVELHARGYERVVSAPLPIARFAAGDGARVERTHLRMRASRTAWLPVPEEQKGPAYQALMLALLWLRERPWTRAGLVTHMPIATRLRGAWAELLPVGLEVRHYGSMRGLDAWKDYDALVTLGDPFLPPTLAERELLLLDLPAGEEAVRERTSLLAAAELEQAHGRLRAPHRTAPARALHVGMVAPADWRGHTTIESVAGAITPHEVANHVERLGGARIIARLLGVHHSSVVRWASGERRCPADAADWLRAQGPPIRQSSDDSSSLDSVA